MKFNNIIIHDARRKLRAKLMTEYEPPIDRQLVERASANTPKRGRSAAVKQGRSRGASKRLSQAPAKQHRPRSIAPPALERANATRSPLRPEPQSSLRQRSKEHSRR